MRHEGIDYSDLLGRPFNAEHWNCWSLVREIYVRGGVVLPEYPYAADPQLRSTLAESVKDQFIRLDGPQPWAIVAIKGRPGIIHTGVILPDLVHVLHVREQCGTVLTRLNILRRACCIEGFYRWQ
jgi:hypothetical protein